MMDLLIFCHLVDSFDMDMRRYFDLNDKKLHLDKVNEDYPALSASERHIIDFLVDVWCGRQERFDFMRASGDLASEHRVIIAQWFINPFYM